MTNKKYENLPSMKFSPITIEILKNFAIYNTGMVFTKGKELSTKSSEEYVTIFAKIPDEIPVNFAIYDLNMFLSILSEYNNPTFYLDKEYLIISEGRETTKYYYADPELLIHLNGKKIVCNEWGKEFVLKLEQIKTLTRKSNILGLEELIIGNNSLYLRSGGDEDDNTHIIDIDIKIIGEIKDESILSIDNLKLIPADYQCKVSPLELTCFQSLGDRVDITYYIANVTDKK